MAASKESDGGDASESGAHPKKSEIDEKQISELYAKLNRLDHYTLLGVSATDDAKAIKRAYYALAKSHHPDRWFRKDIGALRAKVEVIFAAITAAEATLSNKTKRAAYDEYLREVLKTKMNRRQAEALEADKKWQAAAETWARIVERLPTNAEVYHRWANALLHAGSGSLEAAQAAAMRAIDLDTTRVEYRITAAHVHLAEGRDRSALAQLSIAITIEPDDKQLAALHAAISTRVLRKP